MHLFSLQILSINKLTYLHSTVYLHTLHFLVHVMYANEHLIHFC